MSQSEYDSYVNGKATKNNSRNSIRNREPCTPISIQAPVKQDEFFDMRFCGKRGG